MRSYPARLLAACCVLMLAVTASGCGSSSHASGVTSSPGGPRGTAGAGPTPASSAPSGPKQPFTLARNTSAGPLMVTTLTGARSGVTGKVWVWTPPQYNDPKYAGTKFPVVEFFTGNTGVNYNFWSDERVEPTMADDVHMVQAGQATPFIMVMPILQLSTRQDTECSDRPDQPQMATWMASDVVDMVKANFRVLDTRDGWGTTGASSGAFCAVKLALQYPQTYKAAVSWCGYFDPEPETGPTWTPQQLAANSPTQMIKTSQPDTDLLLLAGDNPRYRADDTRMSAFAALVKPPTTVQTVIQKGGAHLTGDLEKLIPQILQFLSANLSQPGAT